MQQQASQKKKRNLKVVCKCIGPHSYICLGPPIFKIHPWVSASLDSVAEVLYSSATVSVWDTQDPAVSIPHVSGIVEHFL